MYVNVLSHDCPARVSSDLLLGGSDRRAETQPPRWKAFVRRGVAGAESGWNRQLWTASSAARSNTRRGLELTTSAAITEPSVPTVYSTPTSPAWPARKASRCLSGPAIDSGRRSPTCGLLFPAGRAVGGHHSRAGLRDTLRRARDAAH